MDAPAEARHRWWYAVLKPFTGAGRARRPGEVVELVLDPARGIIDPTAEPIHWVNLEKLVAQGCLKEVPAPVGAERGLVVDQPAGQSAPAAPPLASPLLGKTEAKYRLFHKQMLATEDRAPTQAEAAEHLGRDERTVARVKASLRKKGYL